MAAFLYEMPFGEYEVRLPFLSRLSQHPIFWTFGFFIAASRFVSKFSVLLRGNFEIACFMFLQ